MATATESKLALTGTVVGNGVVYQGVSMSSVPIKFLLDNCVDCADLLRVLVIANGVTIKTTVSYVKNSQYWFMISFDYADTGLTPVFQYTVQINPIYANYFRPQDLIQKLYQTIDPVNIPKPDGAVLPNNLRGNLGTDVINSGGTEAKLPSAIVNAVFKQ